MKDNPEFKDEWYVKRISNPAYKGVWNTKKIVNPEFKDDDGINAYEDFGFIGFDLWQVKETRKEEQEAFVVDLAANTAALELLEIPQNRSNKVLGA